MKIAINHQIGSFSDRWIEYCKESEIDYKIVNAYDNDIIEQVSDCDGFMWHFHNTNPKDSLFAKQLIYSLSKSGKKVFPDFNTVWHFDDKIGQKYLLESVNAPFIPTNIFYSKDDAKKWISNAIFPVVFKLRGGSGSSNVKLVKNKNQATKIINKAFGSGFSQSNSIDDLKERFRKFSSGNAPFYQVVGGIFRIFYPTSFSKVQGKERGYVYFQDFIPNNNYDIRVIVIGDKAFAIKRMVRKNDFRASGSGKINYEKEEIDSRTIRISFEISKIFKSKCLAFDFVFSEQEPLISEISYGFSVNAYDKCVGYWDDKMDWYPGKFNPQSWMVDLIVNEIISAQEKK